jgi:hypothetical protein
MLKKLQVAAIVMCMMSYAAAGTVAIGTASSRGDMRVDSYTVNGDATLFDGSVVETGQVTADLHLNKGTEVTLATGSRGTLYTDRMVLQQGQTELTSSNSFKIEANGLRVSASSPNSRGMVTVKSGNTVEVAALNGSFGITNNHGVLVASVRPGQPLSFAIAAGAPDLQLHADFDGTGTVSTEGGNYFLTINGQKFQIKGKDLGGDVGKTVKVKGTVEGLIANGVVSGETPASDAIAVIHVHHHAAAAGLGGFALEGWIIGGVAAAAAVGVYVGVHNTSSAGTPTSL